jgi:von Willebrand factor type A C-terminal domain/von Willebrand factor type A domain
MTTFTAATYQNEFLPAGEDTVDAIVTISAVSDTNAPATGPISGEACEIIICDTSGSMEEPSTKIRAAREATATAVGLIRDGVWFAVISGDNTAEVIYPRASSGKPVLVQASAATRREAQAAAMQMYPSGGTAIGMWLALANDLFRTMPGALRHAILLTDGKNESETAAHLDAVLHHCIGNFQCDCRGVGTDWEVAELRKIANALLGTVDIIADPAHLTHDFSAMMQQAMGKTVSNAALRVWVPQGATLQFVKQVAPDIDDLTHKAVQVNPLTRDFSLGSWGSESRDYHIQIKVKPGGNGDEMLAGRSSVVVGDTVVGQALIKAIWTNDEHMSARINREVAHYTGQAELADAIQVGLAARAAGDTRTATIKLGRAVQLAQETGNTDTTRLLAKVVDVQDAATGTVRLKGKVEAEDEMTLDTRSTRTTRVNKPAQP